MRSMHRRFAGSGSALALAFTAGTIALAGAPAAHAADAPARHAPQPHTATAGASCSQAYLPLPDPACTPGALNPTVSQSTINSTICVSGWTATVRPSTSYTNRLKAQQIVAYGYADTSMADYEEDHFIPLELGGSPTSPLNLWPEPHYNTNGGTSYGKDGVETKLKNAVCSGKVQLAPAQNAIATDWTTALSTLGLA
ncbi:hypothetical protein OG455_03475 [Kitasatospora sp. NBC_01287]|uniref:hypothetical protein n=1 Tax=Kitasatospora sp. NBC_01287 TaxID=2903573 RepID=UPI0022549A2D|nr:hypothetical protein [Kitasatospora sp. NBC_01287]MCX4744590.1 hypothetical protein [Kitasatospora sp. NBC_01287]